MYKKTFLFLTALLFFFTMCSKQQVVVVEVPSSESKESAKILDEFPNKAYFHKNLPLPDNPSGPFPNVIKAEIIENQKRNTNSISFLYHSESGEIINLIVKEYNYLPSAEKNYFFSFTNGNKIGFLPLRDENIHLSAWNDTRPISELIFIDIINGTLIPLHVDYGFNFSILKTPENDICWLILRKNESDYLQRFDPSGLLLSNIRIPIQRDRKEYSGYWIDVNDDGIFLLGGSIDWEDTFELSENKDELIYIETKVYDYSSHKN